METARKLLLQLFGSFSAKWSDGTIVAVSSAKHRALLALLATAANGTHSRTWLQETLWSLSGEEHGRASLRKALSDLRKTFGSKFDNLFDVKNIDVRIRLKNIKITGDRRDGEFLEGIDIPETGFRTWLNEKRNSFKHEAFKVPSLVTGKITPSIAVVPFTIRNGGKNELHLSDLLTLEVTRSLTRSKFIDVISHLSSRQFSQRLLDLNTVRSALAIDYLVYGTIALEDDRFRVDADFVDAKTGSLHWTRQFVGKTSDVLDGSHNVVTELSAQIGQAILSASIELARSRPLPDIESHALLMSSITFMHQHRLANFSRARQHIEELIRRAPTHSILHAWLGKWYVLSIAQGWSTDIAADTTKAADCTNRALDINPSCAFSLAVDGMIQSNKRKDFSLASSRFTKALQIDPSNAFAWLLNSRLHAFTGNGKLAVDCAERANMLSPIDPHRYFFDCLSATAYLADHKFDRALQLADRSLASNHRHTSTLRVKIVVLEKIGRRRDAQNSMKKLLQIEPNLTVKTYLENHPAAEFETARDWANALEKAGLPKQ